MYVHNIFGPDLYRPKQFKNMMISGSFDELIRSAECLESEKKNGIHVSIGLNHIQQFFGRISNKTIPTHKGTLFLATHGIDTSRTERILRNISRAKKNEKEEKTDRNGTYTILPKARPLSASEQYDLIKWDSMNWKWKDIEKQTISVSNHFINSVSISSNKNICSESLSIDDFNHKLNNVKDHRFAAQEIAKKMNRLPSNDAATDPGQFISNCLDYYSEDSIIRDLFLALQEIGQHCSVKDRVSSTVRFLQKQFYQRIMDSFSGPTKERAFQYSKNHFGAILPSKINAGPMEWIYNWFAIRSGFSGIISSPNDFLALYNGYWDKDIPINEDQKRMNQPESKSMAAFQQLCYDILYGESLSNHSSFVVTVEDFLFYLFAPLRSCSDNQISQKLNDIKLTIQQEKSRIIECDPSNGLLYSLFLLLSQQDQMCISELMKNVQDPIALTHLCLAIKLIGVVDHVPYLSEMVYSMVQSLPQTMIKESINYLALTDDSSVLTKYLSEISSTIAIQESVAISNKQAKTLLSERLSNEDSPVLPLKVLFALSWNEKALKFADELVPFINYFSINQLLDIHAITSVLSIKLGTQNAIRISHIFAFAVLSSSDKLDQRGRKSVIETTNEMNISNDNNGQKIQVLLKICEIYCLLDENRYDEVTEVLMSPNSLIPMSIHDVSDQIEFFNDLGISSASIICTSALQLLVLLLDHIEENREYLEALVKFCTSLKMNDQQTYQLIQIRKLIGGLA